MDKVVLNVLIHPKADGVDLTTSIAALGTEYAEVILALWGAHHMCPAAGDGPLELPDLDQQNSAACLVAQELGVTLWQEALHDSVRQHAALAADLLQDMATIGACRWLTSGMTLVGTCDELDHAAALHPCDWLRVVVEPTTAGTSKWQSMKVKATECRGSLVHLCCGDLDEAQDKIVKKLLRACDEAEGQVSGDGVANRVKRFEEALTRALQEAKRDGHPLALPHRIMDRHADGDWDMYFGAIMRTALLENSRIELYSPPLSCCICSREITATSGWHQWLQKRCCATCVNTCPNPKCGSRGASFPTENEPPLSVDDSRQILLFRASFLHWHEEAEDEKTPWRSAGCLNCNARGTHLLHSGLLHIGDRELPNWTRANGKPDAQMSCTTKAVTALQRSMGGQRMVQQAEKGLESAVDAKEKEVARARVKEEKELWRHQVHVILCNHRGPHILDLSSWLERAKAFGALPSEAGRDDNPNWTLATDWAKCCGVDEKLWYSICWGEHLSEVLLLRASLREDHVSAATVPLSAVDECLLQRCAEVYDAGWCSGCAEALEVEARTTLLQLARNVVKTSKRKAS